MTTKTKVLVSGFEPFGGAKLNPSELLVHELKKIEFSDIELSTIVLPVEFDRAAEILLHTIKQVKPAVVIAFGQAEGRTAITPEKIAINLDDARIPDNSGDHRENKIIDENGPAAFFSTLPVEKIVESIKEEGVAASLSLSAGSFVCNHLFYVIQRALEGSKIKFGFIHVPLISEQSTEFPGQPTMDLALLIQGARAAIHRAL